MTDRTRYVVGYGLIFLGLCLLPSSIRSVLAVSLAMLGNEVLIDKKKYGSKKRGTK